MCKMLLIVSVITVIVSDIKDLHLQLALETGDHYHLHLHAHHHHHHVVNIKDGHLQLAPEAGDMEQVLVAGATVGAECQGGGEQEAEE